jgi:hypothetical protein
MEDAVSRLLDWISGKQPARVEVYCDCVKGMVELPVSQRVIRSPSDIVVRDGVKRVRVPCPRCGADTFA